MRLIFWIMVLAMLTGIAHSEEVYPDEQIVNAIYLAEGGAKTNHPYGILTKYKVTTPRQACFNTVRNQRKRHKAHDCGYSYLECLQRRYCPIGAKNDPTGLNKNWLKNVRYFLKKGGEYERDN